MKTNGETLEQISGLMDGQEERDASLFLVRRLINDEGLQATWSRYHLIRDCIQHRGEAFRSQGLHLRISAALESGAAEDMPIEVPHTQGWRWLKPAAGMATAAAVALSAILFVQQNGSDVTPGAEAPALAAQPDFVAPNAGPAQRNVVAQPVSASNITAVLTPMPAPDLSPYILRHHQASQGQAGPGYGGLVTLIAGETATRSAEDSAEPAQADTTVPAQQ